MHSLHSFCAYPFTKLQVYANGAVNHCCYQSEHLGNVFEQSLEDLWFSEKASEIRKATLHGNLHSSCKGWGGCPFISMPRVLKDIPVSSEWPSFLELSLPSTHCNIGGTQPTPETACFMCPRSAAEFVPDQDLTSELVDRIKPIMPYLNQLAIVGLAEPFWKDAAFQVLEELEFDKYRESCLFSTFTNGSVLTPERQTRLKDLCPRFFMHVSIDAATAETYRSVRRLDLFERIVDHVENLVKIRNPDRQAVHIVNNINLRNIHECVEMVRLAKRLGADKVAFNATHDGGYKRPELDPYLVNASNAALFRRAQQDAAEEGVKVGIPVYFWRDLDLGLSQSRPSPAYSDSVGLR